MGRSSSCNSFSFSKANAGYNNSDTMQLILDCGNGNFAGCPDLGGTPELGGTAPERPY